MTGPARPAAAPQVTAAVYALRVAHAATRDEAARLLQSWARRDELDDNDMAAVLAVFPERG